MNSILKESVPLSPENCFSVFKRNKSGFNFPLHHHDEYELTFIRSAAGARRIVGDSIETVEETDLVLIGPNLVHSWNTHLCKSRQIEEITIQWHSDLFDQPFISSKHLCCLRQMLSQSLNGIVFPAKTASSVYPLLRSLNDCSGFASFIQLTSILNQLSTSENYRTLSFMANSHIRKNKYPSRRLREVFDHLESHYHETVTLREAAALIHMSEAAFSRFFKQRTGNTFIESLNDIRLYHICRLLIETKSSVSDIAYQCGFNNYSHFHRLFRKKKNCTPKEFRDSCSDSLFKNNPI